MWRESTLVLGMRKKTVEIPWTHNKEVGLPWKLDAQREIVCSLLNELNWWQNMEWRIVKKKTDLLSYTGYEILEDHDHSHAEGRSPIKEE